MILEKRKIITIATWAALCIPLCIAIVYKQYVPFYHNFFPSAQSLDLESVLAQGMQLQKEDRTQEALKKYYEALQNNPSISHLLLQLGQALAETEQYDQALLCLQNVVMLSPNFIPGYISFGKNLSKKERYAEALQIAAHAVQLDPYNIDAIIQLSTALVGSDRLPEALVQAERAIALDSNNVEGYLVRGHAYYKQGLVDRAIADYTRALELAPNSPEVLFALGVAHYIVKQLDRGLDYLLRAEKNKKDFTQAHTAIADIYWAKGDLKNLWKYHRLLWKHFGVDPSKMGVPLWDGSNLQGKTILVYAEQGLGDTLQFIRYAKILKAQGATVICRVQKELVTLLSQQSYIDKIITVEEQPGVYLNYQVPLFYIPGIVETNCDKDIPADVPYIKADENLIKLWKSNLNKDIGFKIGLCWCMDAKHEIKLAPWARRSVSPQVYEPLADVPNTHFYSLQKHEYASHLPAAEFIKTFGPDLDAAHGRFMDTAAIIMNMDLIITVDTSIAHLAAALGKPVWMILPYSPASRWYLQGNTTAWYPNMRIFRSPKPFDWDSVSKELVGALKALPAKK